MSVSQALLVASVILFGLAGFSVPSGRASLGWCGMFCLGLYLLFGPDGLHVN